jgi:hypothetical protein
MQTQARNMAIMLPVYLRTFPRPWKQFGAPVDRVVSDTSEDIAQVSFRIESIELGRFNDRLHLGSSNFAAVGSGE